MFQEHVHFVSGPGNATGVSVNKSFKDASSPQEAIEALMNAMATAWSIRPYDYGYLAILRALHKARYFYNIAPDEKIQLALLLESIQKCFDKNTCRGQDGRPPLTYTEVLEVCKMVATNHGYPELNLFQGDGYSGSKRVGSASQKDVESLRKNVTAMSQELSQLKRSHHPPSSSNHNQTHQKGRQPSKSNQPTRRSGSGQSGSRNDNRVDRRKDSVTSKLLQTCQSYNLTGTICSNNCSRKHKCNYLKSDGTVCWKDHPSIQHPR